MSSQACPDGPLVPEPVSAALIRAARAHRSLAGQLLGEVGLHPGQELLAFLLADGPRPPSVLASAMGVEPPTVTKMLQRMERQGLVERSSDPTDGRVRPVSLTEAGHAARERAVGLWASLETATVGGLDAAERAELIRLLGLVAGQIEAATSDHSADPGGCGPLQER